MKPCNKWTLNDASLFGRNNSLLGRKNSLFGSVGSFDTGTC
jgi:hypothetical protein